MTSNPGPSSSTSRVIYPELPDPLTAEDLHRLFSPTLDEQTWAPTVTRTPNSQVGLLVQLKIFQTIGRFRRVSDIPGVGIEHVARQLGVEFGSAFAHPDRSLYRHRPVILKRLGVTGWGTAARELCQSTMMKIAKTRTDPADIINAAVDALIRHRFELPAIIALRRLAGTAHRKVNAEQWCAVFTRLEESKRSALDALLVVDPTTQRSPFADLCRAPGRASRKNLNALIDRYHWLATLPDPTAALQPLADSKVLKWANEAMRLNVLELRKYVMPRRQTLLLALIRHARGQVLDDLTQMLLRLVRKVEWKSEQRLEQWHADRRAETDALIRAFHDSLILHGSGATPIDKLQQLEDLFTARGGREQLEQGCALHLQHEKQNWRPFAQVALQPLRSALLRVVSILPLQATATTRDLLCFVDAVSDELPPFSDYYRIDGVLPDALPREWRALVHDDPEDAQAFNRRQLEVVTVLELATAIKAGEMFVCGSLSHDRFWDRLPPYCSDPLAISAYAAARGWHDGADGLLRSVKEAIRRQAAYLDRGLADDSMGFIRRAKDGRPVVSPIHALGTPASAIDLEKQMMAHMPERAVLAAIANTENWTHWGRHFGLPSRLAPQIKDARHRYVLAAFAYGCGLGPTEAARHLGGTVSADQLAFVDRRHVDIADLRAASADLINLYSRYELPRQWGSGESAAADGTHFETYEDNLLAEHHIRYGKTGGIAYRHIADNYIALFSRFIACGTYEATYILDALLQNLSDLHPKRVHADTHGQSAAVFGLAYLLGIELMPRIRRWRNLRLYRADRDAKYRYIDSMFSGTVNWTLIREHYPQFMQLTLANQGGSLAPSAVLARINSYSTRNPFALALQELGKAVRTAYLLEWIMNDSLRRTVHEGTTKIERHHKFAKHLAFGGDGLFRTNDPADQEKAIVYNELVANAVALQTVVDQTQALHALKSNGVPIDIADLAYLSPYPTSKLKRFGDYPTNLVPEAMPVTTGLPV